MTTLMDQTLLRRGIHLPYRKSSFPIDGRNSFFDGVLKQRPRLPLTAGLLTILPTIMLILALMHLR